MKTYRKNFRIIVILGLLAALGLVPVCAASVTVSIPDASGAEGASSSVPIVVKAAEGLGALQMSVTYDPTVLEPTDVEPGELLSGLVDFNITSPGVLRVAMATNQPINGEGEIIIMTFNVLGGSQSTLGLSDVRAWEQATSFEMMVSGEPGSFTVSGGMPLWLIGLIGFIVLAAIVILVVKMRSGSKVPAPAPASQPFVPATSVEPPTPVVSRPAPSPAPPREHEIACSSCGKTIDPGSRFCAGCGTPVEVIPHCPKCGQTISKKAKFCTSCGSTI